MKWKQKTMVGRIRPVHGRSAGAEFRCASQYSYLRIWFLVWLDQIWSGLIWFDLLWRKRARERKRTRAGERKRERERAREIKHKNKRDRERKGKESQRDRSRDRGRDRDGESNRKKWMRKDEGSIPLFHMRGGTAFPTSHIMRV